MKKKQDGKVKRWLIRIGFTLLILISLGLIFNEQIKNYLVGSYSPTISKKSVAENEKKKANFNFSKVKSLDFQTVAKARASKQKINIIGSITIPGAKVNLPIAKGVDNVTLALAAGTLRSDMKMGEGNYAVAGYNMHHNRKILFTPLYKKAKVGQKIYLSDLKYIYEYKTYKRVFIKATRVDVVKNTPGKKIVTLITCDATGTNRLMVRGKFVKKMKFKKAPKKVQKEVSAKFNNNY